MYNRLAYFFLYLGLMISSLCLFSQQIKIGDSPTNINPSAMLEFETSNKGILLPRLTTFQRDRILNPSEGLMIYNLNTKTIQTYDGSLWGKNSFYENDGTLISNRKVDLNSNTLRFENLEGISSVSFEKTGAYSLLKIDAFNRRVGINLNNEPPTESLDVRGNVKVSEEISSDKFFTFWDANGKYEIGDVLIYKGRMYRNISGNNTETPDTLSVDWVSESGTDTNMYNSDDVISSDRIVDLNSRSLTLTNATSTSAFSISYANSKFFDVNAKKSIIAINKTNPIEPLDIGGNMNVSNGDVFVANNISSERNIKSDFFYTLWENRNLKNNYRRGAVVLYNGKIYRNLTGSNANSTPNADATNWRIMGQRSTIYNKDSKLSSDRVIDLDDKFLKFTNATNNASFKFTNTSGTIFGINSLNEYVGINTDNPQLALDVVGNISSNSNIYVDKDLEVTENINGTNFFTEWSTSASYKKDDIVLYSGKFYTNMTGAKSTTPPSNDLTNWGISQLNIYNRDSKLLAIRDVDFDSKSLKFENLSAVNSFSVNDSLFSIDGLNKRVGINTKTPSEALEVVGNLVVKDHLYSENFNTNYLSNQKYNVNDIVLYSSGIFFRNISGENKTSPADLDTKDWTRETSKDTSIFNTDGFIAENRQVDLGGKNMRFNNLDGSNAFLVSDSNVNPIMSIDATNKYIGIAHSKPVEAIDLKGNIKVSEHLFTKNFYTQWDALKSKADLYKKDDVVLYKGKFYRKLNGSNTSTPDDIGTGEWGGTKNIDYSLYTIDGTLEGNRIIDFKQHSLNFTNATKSNTFEISNASDTVILLDASSKRLAIGKNDPKASLDVRGSIKGSGNVLLENDLLLEGHIKSRTFNTLWDSALAYTQNSILIHKGYFYKNISGNNTSTTEPSKNNLYWSFLGSTLYSSDGILNSDRTINLNGKSLAFINSDIVNSFSIATNVFSVDGKNNRVGIGTNSPNYSLDIAGTLGIGGVFLNKNASKGTPNQVLTSSTDTFQWSQFKNIYTDDGVLSSDRTLNLGNNKLSIVGTSNRTLSVNTNVFLVDAMNDRVAFGTDAPQEALDVNGDLNVSQNLMTSNFHTDWNPNQSYQINNVVLYKGNFYKKKTSVVSVNSPATDSTNWEFIGISLYAIDSKIESNRTVDLGNNTLSFEKANKVGAFNVDGNTFSVDGKNSRVGMSTKTPAYLLDVNTDIGIKSHIIDNENSIGQNGQYLTKTSTGVVWRNPKNPLKKIQGNLSYSRGSLFFFPLNYTYKGLDSDKLNGNYNELSNVLFRARTDGKMPIDLIEGLDALLPLGTDKKYYSIKEITPGVLIEPDKYYVITPNTPFGNDNLSNYNGNNYLGHVYKSNVKFTTSMTDVKADANFFIEQGASISFPKN